MTDMVHPLCSIDGCAKRVRARGWCAAHYERWRRTGSTVVATQPTVEDRFWAKVDKTSDPNGCWLWTASVGSHGYGAFGVGQAVKVAHRIAYELTVGPIPEGLHLDHLCRRHACVNPAHLHPVTLRENVGRGLLSDLGESTSVYRGVFLNKGRWRAQIRLGDGSSHRHLGTFSTEEAAAHAYCDALSEVDPDAARSLRGRIPND